ncbi:DUF3910 family protein [Bacillus sp. UNC437CL72CviS29]|uniref:DUF3910 family protein n=1 Tax=Bacillus sp. UNC437CL72CviS29 TaxID=1340430 RepID=UPI00047E49B7|nr:DUF3910 family protein [Bacillus sp. UNC437CL72CviS29]
MNLNAKIDWIGTPKPYHDGTTIDFSLEHDDNRYKLIVLNYDQSVQYKFVQYGIKPGSQKPFPIDIPFQEEMLPLIERILQDPYVQAFRIL